MPLVIFRRTTQNKRHGRALFHPQEKKKKRKKRHHVLLLQVLPSVLVQRYPLFITRKKNTINHRKKWMAWETKLAACCPGQNFVGVVEGDNGLQRIAMECERICVRAGGGGGSRYSTRTRGS